MNNNTYEDGINLVKKKRNNKKKMIILIGSLLVVLCGIIAFFVINYYYKDTNSVSFDKYDVYQYFSGVKYNYTGRAKYEDNKLISINDEGKQVTIGDSPIYYQSIDNECIIPITMGLFFLDEGSKSYRINYFSKLLTELFNNDEMSFITYNDSRKFIDNAFLFDGKNTYVFPYSTDVVIEGKTYNLSPLSYVVVNYKDSAEIYNKEKDEYNYIEDIKDDVIATLNNKKINLSTDMIMYETGERLLIKNVSKLNIYE